MKANGRLLNGGILLLEKPVQRLMSHNPPVAFCCKSAKCFTCCWARRKTCLLLVSGIYT